MSVKDSRLFFCDCRMEGCAVEKCEDFVTVEGKVSNDFSTCRFINLTFWQQGMKHLFTGKLTLRERIRCALNIILRGDIGWTDMVCLSRSTAKKLAYHILYLADKKG